MSFELPYLMLRRRKSKYCSSSTSSIGGTWASFDRTGMYTGGPVRSQYSLEALILNLGQLSLHSLFAFQFSKVNYEEVSSDTTA